MTTLIRLTLALAILFLVDVAMGTAQDKSTTESPTKSQQFGSLKFRNVGPFRGGRSNAVCGVIGDSQTYYFGSHYRIYGIMESGKGVYFDTDSPLEKGKKIYLNVSLETINKRMPI